MAKVSALSAHLTVSCDCRAERLLLILTLCGVGDEKEPRDDQGSCQPGDGHLDGWSYAFRSNQPTRRGNRFLSRERGLAVRQFLRPVGHKVTLSLLACRGARHGGSRRADLRGILAPTAVPRNLLNCHGQHYAAAGRPSVPACGPDQSRGSDALRASQVDLRPYSSSRCQVISYPSSAAISACSCSMRGEWNSTTAPVSRSIK